MNALHETNATRREGLNESEIFNEAVPMLDPDIAMEADMPFDEGVLAEVPYALDAWMSQQCFGLC